MKTIRIAFVGDFYISDNYPNTKNFLSSIEGDERFDVVSCEGGISEGNRIYVADGGAISKLSTALGMFVRAFKAAIQVNKKTQSACDVVYIPYPSLLVLLCYSYFFKKKDRPFLVVDCFISIYDTVVMDRQVFAEGGWLAKILLHLERRSLKGVDMVLADTAINADHLYDLFAGEREKYQAINLCINESLFKPKAVESHDSKSVLFVGSFVPLQGVDVVVDAAVHLADREDIKVQLVGDGQTAPEIESQLGSTKTNIEWHRGWYSIEEIAEFVAHADICLGVFGSGNKTYRVLPYKAYMAMACGKALISSRVDDGVIREAELPFLTLSSNSGKELASEIIGLLDSSELRDEYAKRARAYYESCLSNARAVDAFYALLLQNLHKAEEF